MGLRDWLSKRRSTARVRRLVAELFEDPDLLRGTSLRPAHRARFVVLGHDEDAGDIVKVYFGIVRHPRPYKFSRQHHKVAEIYEYDVPGRRVQVTKGINITRQEGRDAD